MATLIQLRRGTDAEWTSANPTLAAGEVGISTDINKFKIGDGTTAWTSLSYASLTPTEIQTAIDNSVAALVDGAPDLLNTLNELAAALGDDPNIITTLQNDKADLNSPTFTGYVEFTGITDFTDSVVIGIDALPDQTGQTGKYLTTDGTDASWAEIPAGSPHPFSMIG